MTTLYANPYDISAQGFYFKSFEEFQEKYDANLPVEEYEIDFIEGDDPELFETCSINQGDIALWFDEIELLDDSEKAEIYYRCSCLGENIQDALVVLGNSGMITENSVLDYVYDYIDDTGLLCELPESLRCYFDFERFASDLVVSGEISEFSLQGKNFCAIGF